MNVPVELEGVIYDEDIVDDSLGVENMVNNVLVKVTK